MVNVSGDCCQGDPLQGIKRFVKIAGIPNLKKSPISSEIFHLNFALSQDKNFTKSFPVV